MSTKIKIVHIITGLTTGGAETALYNLLLGGLVDLFDSRVISLRTAGTMGAKLDSLGIPVVVLGMEGALPSRGSLRKLRREVRAFKPDLIQGWMYHGNLAATVATLLAPRRPRLAWNIRHSLYGLTAEKLMTRQVIRANRFFSNRPDVILYNSALSQEQHETFGVKSKFGRVIPNGFDLERLRPSESTARILRKTLGISINSRVVGHVARFHPMKNHVGFVKAAVQVGSAIGDVHFVLVGRDVVPGNDSLTGLVPEAMLKQFHWLGDRDDVPDLMRAIDILCLSSSWGEGFPNVLGEAMAAGVPCVATNVGDSAIVIGDTGLVVQPCDEESLAVALKTMLDMSVSDRKLLGIAARARIAERYSLKAIVEKYAAIYEGLASNH